MMDKIATRIDGTRIYLRPLAESDASLEYARWLNDPEVNAYLETRQTNIEELRTYITSKNESKSALFFGIFWRADGKHVGNVKLEPIDVQRGVATMGILIGEKEFWGKGIATEVTNLIVDYAFTVLNLKEINLGVIAQNKPAIRVYEKCGFETYRIDSMAIDHDDEKFDQIWMRKIKT